MDHDKLRTGFCKSVADKLRAIIGTYDRLIRLIKELALHKRFLRDLNEMFGLTGQSDMIGDNGTIKHVYDAHKEEKSLLTMNPSILNIDFPQLIGGGYHAIVRKSLGIFDDDFALWTKHIHEFA